MRGRAWQPDITGYGFKKKGILILTDGSKDDKLIQPNYDK